jgi:hypothetical protein
MRLHDLKYLTIDLIDLPVQHLRTTWKGFSNKADFLNGIDLILSSMKTKKVMLVLNDIREHQVIGVDSQTEAAEKVKNFVMSNGIFKQAMLSSKDVFIKFGSHNFDKKVQNHVKDEINRFFDREEDAIEWLALQKA